jgi:hypothetical protein
VDSGFFVNTQDGRVATQGQLAGAQLLDDEDKPVAPWHPIRGDRDSSTLWFAVLVKQMRGVFIGMLCIRHSDRQASMEQDGWVEVPFDSIGV